MRILQAGLLVSYLVVAFELAAETKSVRDYLREPDFQEAKLSPKGDRLAVTQLRGLTEALTVVNVADGKVLSSTQFGERVGIASFMWATNGRMRKALEESGNAPEWMIKRGEAHGFYAEENQVELYTRILAFLKKHIG